MDGGQGDTVEKTVDAYRGCQFARVPGLRAALRAAGVCVDVGGRPLALLDEQGELLAILSFVSLGDGAGPP